MKKWQARKKLNRDPAAFTSLRVACRYSSRPPSIPFKQSNLTKPAPNAGFSPFMPLFRCGMKKRA
jgi:hypothetical protein